MTRSELRLAVKRRAREARATSQAALDAHRGLAWLEDGPCPVEDDGGTSCPWCECGCRPARLTVWGICEDCAELEAATHTSTTRRRMVSRLGVRARRGELDAETYQDALRAHRERAP